MNWVYMDWVFERRKRVVLLHRYVRGFEAPRYTLVLVEIKVIYNEFGSSLLYMLCVRLKTYQKHVPQLLVQHCILELELLYSARGT